MHVDARPCSSCPYACATPPGVWEACEYERLPGWDEGHFPPAIGIFLCHHSTVGEKETLCRGWLAVHADSIAVRLALMDGRITPEQAYAEVDVALYATGQEACDAGLAGVEHPDAAARKAIDKITRKRAKTSRRAATATSMVASPTEPDRT